MIIPSYEKGLEVDWTRVIPTNYNDIGMYIHPRICLLFKGMWMPVGECPFSIGIAMETTKDIDCEDFEVRLQEFIPYRLARLKRVFEGKRESIFFDAEEVDILASMLSNQKVTAIVEVMIDDQVVEVEDIPKALYRIIEPFLESYGVIEPLNSDEYRKYKGIRKARVINSKGAGTMDKKKSIIKMVSGTILSALGVAGLVIGSTILQNGFRETVGEIDEVEIIDDFEQTED